MNTLSERGAVQGPGWHGPSPRGGGACRTAARAAPPRPPGEPPSWPHFFPLPPGGGEVGPGACFRNVCGCLWQDTSGASGRTPDTETHSPRARTCAPLRNGVFADGRSGREGPSARRAGVWGPLQRRGPARDCGWPSLGRRRGCVARSSLTLPVNPEGRQGGFGSGVTLSLSAVLLGPRETT